MSPEHAMPLLDLVHRMDRLMELTQSRLNEESQEGSFQTWKGDEIIALLRNLGLDENCMKNMQKHFALLDEACQEDQSGGGGGESPIRKRSKNQKNRKSHSDSQITLEGPTSGLFKNLFQTLHFLLKKEMTHCSDYRLALTQNFVYRSSAPSKRVTEITEDSPMETWLSTKAPTVKQQAVLTLHFWCFNSAVVFDELHKQARCVILTSGTLAPLNSFACELGVPFPNHLEAFHVISPSQVLVAGVSHSPSGREMHAIYKNCANFEFQDELGRMMLSFCEIVPNGILCFLASYSFLERLKSRWENTSMKEQFSQTKHVLFEGRDSQNFESTIRDYYRLIEATKVPHSDRRNGVLLFAVCRGKISEGLDFADDRARLVVTVGIPYPHFKDPQVVLKREFNDLNRRNPPESGHLLLSGSEWYDIQAFRALNQALGRCIRHRNDWGALIMIDKRFVPVTERSWHGVSKWVRKNAQAFDRFDALKHSLEEFVKQRLLTMKLEDDMKDAE